MLQVLFLCWEAWQWSTGYIYWEELWQVWHCGAWAGSCGWLLAWAHTSRPRRPRPDCAGEHNDWWGLTVLWHRDRMEWQPLAFCSQMVLLYQPLMMICGILVKLLAREYEILGEKSPLILNCLPQTPHGLPWDWRFNTYFNCKWIFWLWKETVLSRCNLKINGWTDYSSQATCGFWD